MSIEDSQRARIDAAARELAAWYPEAARDLPWRRMRHDPWAVWVSEVMLQQTRVETVAPRYTEFLERFPDAKSMARADVDAVLGAWSGLGYYRRARMLHAGACWVAEHHDGQVPSDPEELREVPGVGAYTCAAVASIAFGVAMPALDANAERVLARLCAIEGEPARKATRTLLEQVGATLLEAAAVAGLEPGDANQALMDVGSRWCRARRPRCQECVLRPQCLAADSGDPERYPKRRTARTIRDVEMVCARIECDGAVLFFQRSAREREMPGMWELPGFVGGPSEDAPDHLAATIEERCGFRPGPMQPLGTVRHSILDRRIRLHVYSADCRELRREQALLGRADWGFLNAQARSAVGISSMYAKALALSRGDGPRSRAARGAGQR